MQIIKDTLNIMDIQRLIPHRYPFLLIDRVINIETDVRAIGIKNVTVNEPFFVGHFPGRPVMPGVLIIEAMAQTSAAIVVQAMPDDLNDRLVYFMSVESARFRRPVMPGDQLHIHVEKIKNRMNVWKYRGEVKIDGQVAAEAKYTAMIATDPS